ncbi:MAG: hypothetical protein JJU40_02600 [Rhodobacteraceae bacterium]|nr:hypothetical protein [Paracoccaceae bacterium]
MDAERKARAEEARARILASGNQDLIDRLYLLEASQGAQGQHGAHANAPAPSALGGASLLGTAAAVAGGVWLGNLLTGMTLSSAMRDDFGAVAEGMGLDPGALGLGTLASAGLMEDLGLSDLGIGDIGEGLGDFFDI